MSQENTQSQSKPKLLWVGYSPDNQNDFGRFASQILPKLTEKYDVTLFALMNQVSVSSEIGYNLIESGDSSGPLGFQKLVNVINVMQPQHLVLFNYPHVIINYIGALIYSGACNLDNTQVLGFLAMDYQNPMKIDIQALNILDGVLVTTQFAKSELEKAHYEKPIMVVSGGHTPDFMSLGTNKEKYRKELSPKLGSKTFIFYSGLENTFENRLDILIDGFTTFLREQIDQSGKDNKVDVCLMLGCGMVDRGWDIARLMETMCQEKDIPNWEEYLKFSLPNPQNEHPNFTNEYLNLVYNCVDVGVSTSTGQLWGFSNYDMARIGVPQIVPTFGTQGEIFENNTISLAPETYYRSPFVFDASMGTRGVVCAGDLAQAMTMLYTDKKLLEKAGKKAKTLSSKYTWNLAINQLEKAFDEIKVIRNRQTEVNLKK